MKPKRTPWQIQKAVVLALILRELKTRFGAHRLGVAWLFLEPLVHVGIILALLGFTHGSSQSGVSYTQFLLVGMVPFFLFKSVALRVMEGVEGNQGLFTYRHIKPMDVFLARTVLECALYAIVMVAVLLALLWLGARVRVEAPLEFLLLSLTLVAGGLGFGLLLSVAAELMPESKPIFRMLFLPLYLLSGVLFPVAMVPGSYLSLLLWNPLVHAVELLRLAFLPGYRTIPDVHLGMVAFPTLLTLFTGLALYRTRRLAMVAQ